MTITITSPTKQRLRHATTPAVVDDAGHTLTPANDNFVVDPSTRAYHVADSPIERLAAQRKITSHQKQAGDRYFADYYAAGLAPLGAVDYARAMVDGGKPSGGSDYRYAAVDRWNKASSLLSAGTLKIVDRVVLREMSIELAGRDVGFKNAPQARAVAMFVLADGLETLAKHYGIVG